MRPQAIQPNHPENAIDDEQRPKLEYINIESVKDASPWPRFWRTDVFTFEHNVNAINKHEATGENGEDGDEEFHV